MFRPIIDNEEMRRWVTLAGDDSESPFEYEVGSAFPFLSYADYAALFLPETIAAACAWSVRNDLRQFAMFFTIPDPTEYLRDSGFLGGLVAAGADNPKDIESLLTHDNRMRDFLSPYDISHRFMIVPDDRSWLWIGDRDADLAIFGFSTEMQQREFISDAGFKMFASPDDAAAHAMTLMDYHMQEKAR
ncbi:MAG TPA: hypothetical protein VGN46_18040 [Luteibacter sp.]|jgi:hypothetical protein|uniref:hypothetical protein n=1 Tax=Luteibacter sp. TaxID=1886636 RepID=UPI002F3FD6AA